MRLEGWHLIIIIVLGLVLFGGPKLPAMARSLGQSMRIFKSEVREMKKDDSSTPAEDVTPVEGKVVSHREPSRPEAANASTPPSSPPPLPNQT